MSDDQRSAAEKALSEWMAPMRTLRDPVKINTTEELARSATRAAAWASAVTQVTMARAESVLADARSALDAVRVTRGDAAAHAASTAATLLSAAAEELASALTAARASAQEAKTAEKAFLALAATRSAANDAGSTESTEVV